MNTSRPDIQVDDTTAIEACKRARADFAAGGERLRRVHEAGRMLRAVARSSGGRKANSLPEVTSLQTVIQAAGISRKTAAVWQRVGDVPADTLEQFIAGCEAAGTEITISGFLQSRAPKADDTRDCMISLGKLTIAAHARFVHQLETLGSTVFHTTTKGETLVAVVDRLYSEVLRKRVA